jgi:hypothetical protein
MSSSYCRARWRGVAVSRGGRCRVLQSAICTTSNRVDVVQRHPRVRRFARRACASKWDLRRSGRDRRSLQSTATIPARSNLHVSQHLRSESRPIVAGQNRRIGDKALRGLEMRPESKKGVGRIAKPHPPFPVIPRNSIRNPELKRAQLGNKRIKSDRRSLQWFSNSSGRGPSCSSYRSIVWPRIENRRS